MLVGGFRIGRGCRGRSKVVVVEGGIGMVEEEGEEEENMVDDIVVVVVVAVDAEVEGQSIQVHHPFRQFFFSCLFVLIYYISILLDPEFYFIWNTHLPKKNG